MEDNKQDRLDKIDELLKDTSAENRIKFNSDIERSNQIGDNEAIKMLFGNDEAPTTKEDAPQTEVAVKSVPLNDENEEKPESIHIIDETATTIELSEDSDFSQPIIVTSDVPHGAATKVKKPKEKVKLNKLQITLIVIVGVITLWLAMFTVDNTMAANGISPVFSLEVKSYEDGSANYVGLGYKIQFSFDDNDVVTYECLPFWKSGPNDSANNSQINGGASFQ